MPELSGTGIPSFSGVATLGRLTTLLTSLDWVDLSTSELATATATSAGLTACRSASGTTLLAGLNGVDLALGELTGSDTTVWLAILSETVVLYG